MPAKKRTREDWMQMPGVRDVVHLQGQDRLVVGEVNAENAPCTLCYLRPHHSCSTEVTEPTYNRTLNDEHAQKWKLPWHNCGEHHVIFLSPRNYRKWTIERTLHRMGANTESE